MLGVSSEAPATALLGLLVRRLEFLARWQRGSLAWLWCPQNWALAWETARPEKAGTPEPVAAQVPSWGQGGPWRPEAATARVEQATLLPISREPQDDPEGDARP